MLQLSQILLPVDHQEGDLRTAVLKLLQIPTEQLLSLTIKQRAIDARRGHVAFSFTVLAEVKEEAKVLKKIWTDFWMSGFLPQRGGVSPNSKKNPSLSAVPSHICAMLMDLQTLFF